MAKADINEEDEYVFVTHYKHYKTGKIIYAKDYGKKVFCFKKRKKKGGRKTINKE